LNLFYFESHSNLVWKYLNLFVLNKKFAKSIQKQVSIFLSSQIRFRPKRILQPNLFPWKNFCTGPVYPAAHLAFPTQLGLFAPFFNLRSTCCYRCTVQLRPPAHLPHGLRFFSRPCPSGSPPLGAVSMHETVKTKEYSKPSPVVIPLPPRPLGSPHRPYKLRL
jgi:hypothetical protein